MNDVPTDPHRWLEAIDDEAALDWVEQRNRDSLGRLESGPDFADLEQRNLAILDARERIAYPTLRGDQVFNFWRDEDNPRGLWRRAPLADYLAGEPDWTVLIDVDELARQEEENWVWKGADCLAPDYDRCLISLSRGGADAVVVREFDLLNESFVEDGFELPEAKTGVAWVDPDHLYVGTDFGPGSLTRSGYPRVVKRWRRGSPLAEAEMLFEGDADDVWISAYRLRDGEHHYDLIHQAVGFFTSRWYRIGADDQLLSIELPEDAILHNIVAGQMVVELKSDWSTAGRPFQAGALLAMDFEAFMAGGRDFHILLEADQEGAIIEVRRTRDQLLINRLSRVRHRLDRCRFADGRWQRQALQLPGEGTVAFLSATDTTNGCFFSFEDFLNPGGLYWSEDEGDSRCIRQAPSFFDSAGLETRQHFATSRDGTRIPYFHITRSTEAAADRPTLLYGYGGFEVSLSPAYSPMVGADWLERGGSYVVANIRGGGEYGPRWHQAALREHRQKAFDDFIAVAEDLISRGMTRPERLGIRGGSNGGLLMGAMLTQRPDLFGAIVIQVPLLDMRRYHQLLAGASWMAEYGDPDGPDWEFIRRYSPYHRLQADGNYPPVFITTSTRDDRVHPGHARKMVARMQEMGHPVWYYENTEGGHAGAADNRQQARMQALVYRFLWDTLER